LFHKGTALYDNCNTSATFFENISQGVCNTEYCRTFELMKRTILTVEIEPELRDHLQKQAIKKDVTLSRYVRAGLKKISKFKEKKIV
jgi:hypothetical protein